MKLFRFELAFDGEPQDIGILRGLDDIGPVSYTHLDVYKRQPPGSAICRAWGCF